MATALRRALELFRIVSSARGRLGQKIRLEQSSEHLAWDRRELATLLLTGLGISSVPRSAGVPGFRLPIETAREGASSDLNDFVFRAPTNGNTDATHLLEELAATVNRRKYTVGFNETPVRIYVPRGDYLIKRTVTFTNPVELFGGGTFLLRNCSILIAAGPRRSVIRNVMFVDDSDKPTPLALLEIAEGARCLISGAHFNGRSRRAAESGHLRRYGLYCGSHGAFFGSLFENSYFSHCGVNLRVGREGDQTHNLYINNTIDHASVCGALLCNPAGGGMYGGSVEHNQCETGIAIVSEAGSGLDEAKDFIIEGMYCYNNGVGSKDSVAIRIGYDVPGTAGFDDNQKGGVIGSGASAQNIRVEFNYINSDRQYRAVKIRGMSGLVVRNNNQCRQSDTMNSSGGADIEFGGLCAASECRANRNMINGRFDLFTHDPENPAAPYTYINGSGKCEAALEGTQVAGTHKYARRNCSFRASDGLCVLHLDIELDALDENTHGEVTITLPIPVRPDSRVSAEVTEYSGIALTAPHTGLSARSLAGDVRRLHIFETGAQVSPKPLAVRALKPHARLVFSAVYPI